MKENEIVFLLCLFIIFSCIVAIFSVFIWLFLWLFLLHILKECVWANNFEKPFAPSFWFSIIEDGSGESRAHDAKHR